MFRPFRLPIALAALILFAPRAAPAAEESKEEDDPKAREVVLAEGAFRLTAPKGWKRERPRSRIVEHEFSVPGEKEGEDPGRLTIMAAGGSLEANLERWLGQFADRKEERVEPEKIEVARQKVYLVDISGTFRDQRGPFSPAVERPNYRMLGAILETKDHGNLFLKLTGPAKTIEFQAKAFREFVESLKPGRE
jgi:hypothetical protein